MIDRLLDWMGNTVLSVLMFLVILVFASGLVVILLGLWRVALLIWIL